MWVLIFHVEILVNFFDLVGIIISSSVLSGLYVVFDQENQRVGMATSPNCGDRQVSPPSNRVSGPFKVNCMSKFDFLKKI